MQFVDFVVSLRVEHHIVLQVQVLLDHYFDSLLDFDDFPFGVLPGPSHVLGIRGLGHLDGVGSGPGYFYSGLLFDGRSRLLNIIGLDFGPNLIQGLGLHKRT